MNLVILSTVFTLGWCSGRDGYPFISTDVNKTIDKVDDWIKNSNIGPITILLKFNGTTYNSVLYKFNSTIVASLKREGQFGSLNLKAVYDNKTIVIRNLENGIAIAWAGDNAMIINERARYFLVCTYQYNLLVTIRVLKADDFLKLIPSDEYGKLTAYVRKIVSEEMRRGDSGTIPLTTITDAIVQGDPKKLEEFLDADAVDDVVSNYKDFFKNVPGDFFERSLRITFEGKLSPLSRDLNVVIKAMSVTANYDAVVKYYVHLIFGDHFAEPVTIDVEKVN